MISKWNFRRSTVLIPLLVATCVVWVKVSNWDINHLNAATDHLANSDRLDPSNPAMTHCIGYGNPDATEFASTFCKKRLPNTIIIGNTKCGTSALLTFLSQHPQIVRNTYINETHFFDKYYTKGIEWYRDSMPYSLPGQVVIERTPNYFALEYVPGRLFNLDPRIKLILAVRNPVDRVISEYAMHKSGHDKLNKTIRGVKPGDPFPPFEMIWKGYINHFYDTSLENWLQYFRIEQIHIVNGDVLRKSPLQELKEIEQFLNIEPFFQENQFYLNTIRGVFCMSKPRFGQDNCLQEGKGRKHPKVNETVLQMMRHFFHPHNQRFYKLSKKQFDWDNDTTIK